MTLLDLRSDFTRISGRRDLTNAQLDRYINRGQKFLDRRADHKRLTARHFMDLPVGATGVTFSSGCRAIKEVYVMDPAERTEVEKVDHHTLKVTYPEPTAAGPARPAFYSVAYIRTAPADNTGTLSPFWGHFMDVVPDAHDDNGIIWLVPTDIIYVIEVWGKWYTEALTEAKPDSWWSQNSFSTLLHAALRELEIDYRNTAGANDWLASVNVDLADIGFDDAEEDAHRLVRMDG